MHIYQYRQLMHLYRQKKEGNTGKTGNRKKPGRQATDRRQAGNIAKHENRLQGLFFTLYR